MTQSRAFRRAALAVVACCAAAAAPASAGIPTMRGIDHIGITVPDAKQAVAFFTDVIGCRQAMSFGPFRDDQGTFMQDLVNVHPRAVIDQITLVRCGDGSNIEIFQYEAPDQAKTPPKNSDAGGHHLAFYVDDIAAAAAYLRAKDVRLMMGPVPMKEGPEAGQTILYFLAPWGLQLELISYPDGMAYEKGAATVLWSPKAPAK
ncbi:MULTISPECIES: VOC family protein [unclassified Inquilinus]|uniref:VOC family protein n=1 Tax=unclassified Inquilinus TaxID=2645927 RepID=UPI003F938DDF